MYYNIPRVCLYGRTCLINCYQNYTLKLFYFFKRDNHLHISLYTFIFIYVLFIGSHITQYLANKTPQNNNKIREKLRKTCVHRYELAVFTTSTKSRNERSKSMWCSRKVETNKLRDTTSMCMYSRISTNEGKGT